MKRELSFYLVCAYAIVCMSACHPPPIPPDKLLLETAGSRPVYRLDDNLADASLITARRVVREEAVTSFDMHGADLAGWTPGASSSRVTIENGLLVFETQGPDSVTSPPGLSIPMEHVESLQVQMEVSGTNKISLAWRDDSESDFSANATTDIAITPSQECEAYDIRVQILKSWSAPNTCLQQLRFSTTGKAKVVIKSIRTIGKYDRFIHEDAGVARVQLADDSRTCLFLHAPGEIRYRLQLFGGAQFAGGLAALDPYPPIKFSLSVCTEGAVATLIEEQGEPAKWHDVRTDLSSYGGQYVEVILRADCAEPGNILLLSSPLIYQVKLDPREQSINVVWYIIDALRADHLDLYGYPQETAPVLRQLAASGARFERCFSPSTWTKPSVASMLTGVSPLTHRVGLERETLPSSLVLLPQILRDLGYATMSVTQSPFGPRNGYLDRGFDSVSQGGISPLNSAAQPFMETHRDQAFFLLVHVLDTHGAMAMPLGAFMHHRDGKKSFDAIDLYDARVAWADANLGAFIKQLEFLGLFDHTLLIVTADHGESLDGDVGGTGHGGKPYLVRIRVPLVMRLPGVIPAGTQIRGNVQTIDIVPTLLDILGVQPCQQFQGRTLAGLMRGETDEALQTQGVCSIGERPQYKGMVKGDWFLFDDDGKLSLFHLPTDPGQTWDLSAQRSDLTKALVDEMTQYTVHQEAIRATLQADKAPAPLSVDPDITEQLKALGYLD